jgi:hypothetical protein
MPWAVFQFGGAMLILWLGVLRRRAFGLDIRWSMVILAYALAKAFELNDAEVFRFTGGLVSGHTLKHLAAALAAWRVLAAIGAAGVPGQNRRRRRAGPPSGSCVSVMPGSRQ